MSCAETARKCARLPVDPFDIHQSQERFTDLTGGLQGVSGPLTPCVTVCHGAKLVVEQRGQAIQCGPITLAPRLEQGRDFCRIHARHGIPGSRDGRKECALVRTRRSIVERASQHHRAPGIGDIRDRAADYSLTRQPMPVRLIFVCGISLLAFDGPRDLVAAQSHGQSPTKPATPAALLPRQGFLDVAVLDDVLLHLRRSWRRALR